VLDAHGAVRTALGPADDPVLPRSANKPLQALGLLETGWTPDDRALVLAAASHSGEPEHVDVVRAILADAGLDDGALQCPATLPMNDDAADDVLRAGGDKARLTMNCSGKHAAMLAACVVNGWPTDSYLAPDHPMQRALTANIARLAGEPVAHLAVDGCGAPQHGLTLPGLARAFLALVCAEPGSPERRVADACRVHPHLLAGTGRAPSRLIEAVPELLVKDGAEGVYAGAIAGAGAIAVKIEDGAERAASAAFAAALRLLGVQPSQELDALARPPILGGGVAVGELRAVF
jgi:L-asparaginase II